MKSSVLAFFDPRVESEIVVDASPFGLGAVLQQRGKPIAFASSTLTPTQRNYAHIEKELLAVVYVGDHQVGLVIDSINEYAVHQSKWLYYQD
ncbi:hypothetical protein AVEN_70-1 [Araneus ventricosus]|uniref:Reverse transcriptase/retrotransposon-derived protein RNase H-like domain-containing protein n=1 Tax=Araneus ventricosus TaxID=182803 RepID=A0A4Y2T361_ARAVE|nr:hypothetical protein AVEN_70-1 [Araneus ventricosus]